MSFPSADYYAGPGFIARYTPAHGFEVKDLATGNWQKANHQAARIMYEGRAITQSQAELAFKRQQQIGFPFRNVSTQVGLNRLLGFLRRIPK